MVDIGILFSNMKSLTKWPSDSWPIRVTSQPIRLSTNFMTLIPRLTFTELQLVSMEHSQRVWHASRECFLFRHLVPSFETWLYSHCWDIFPELALSFPDTIGTFSILLLLPCWICMIKISQIKFLTFNYYKNVYLYKMEPYYPNLSLLYENLEKAQVLWCVQSVSAFSKTNGPISPTELQAVHIVTFCV